MLPDGRRLRSKWEFEQVFSKGRVFDTPLVRIIWTRGRGKAAVVAAKGIGSLARRNTVRRRWRETIRELLDLIPGHVDMVVMVKANGASAGSLERAATLREALKRVGEASTET